jgi:N-acyl-D-amino-acid deacylase
MGRLGTGVFQLANEIHRDPVAGRRYHEWLRDLAVASGRPVTFIMGTSKAAPGAWRTVTDLCAETVAAGGRMVGSVHSREFATVLSFRANLPFDKLPQWSTIRRLPLAEQRAALLDPTMRARLVHEAMNGPYGAAIGAEARQPEWDWVWVYDSPLPPYTRLSDLAAAASATAGGRAPTTPVDVMIDLALASDFDQLFLQPFANQVEDDVLALLRHPGTVIGASDSGAHVSQITDASIPTHLLAHWVRERQAITWEDAIRMMTSQPAALWGFHDRGRVGEGLAADLVVFDPATVAPAMPTIETDLPAGAKRIRQGSHGFRATIVNGQPVFVDGEHTGAVPGRLLRGPLAVAGSARS